MDQSSRRPRNLLHQAIAAVLVDQVRRNGWDDQKPEAPPLRDLIRAKSGEKFGKYFLEPVPPGHPMEPAPKKFSIDGDVAYVREAEYPALLEVLARNRAKVADPGPAP